MDFSSTIIQLAYATIFFGLAYFAVDQYRLWRERQVEAWRKDGLLPQREGVADSSKDGKGELSTAAKYAIWNYMFSLFAVGGTIIGIVSGIAGYMIKDLVTERAIQNALNKMQEPLSHQLDKFADANAALKVAAERINDSKTFPRAVADDLVARYPDKVRGERGSDGKNGVDGKDGKDGVPGKDGPSVAEVTSALMKSHAAELRGKDGSNGKDGINGKDGVPGKDGVNGKDGVSPERGEIAELVVKQYRDQLRGPPGENGTNGSNGQSPKVEDVAAALWESHSNDIIRQLGERKQSR
jgi:hypothetical protein